MIIFIIINNFKYIIWLIYVGVNINAISSSKNSSSRSYRNNLNDINEAQSASPLMKNTIYDTDRNNVVTNESSKLKYSEYYYDDNNENYPLFFNNNSSMDNCKWLRLFH